jgi:hypothetical protein
MPHSFSIFRCGLADRIGDRNRNQRLSFGLGFNALELSSLTRDVVATRHWWLRNGFIRPL